MLTPKVGRGRLLRQHGLKEEDFVNEFNKYVGKLAELNKDRMDLDASTCPPHPPLPLVPRLALAFLPCTHMEPDPRDARDLACP